MQVENRVLGRRRLWNHKIEWWWGVSCCINKGRWNAHPCKWISPWNLCGFNELGVGMVLQFKTHFKHCKPTNQLFLPCKWCSIYLCKSFSIFEFRFPQIGSAFWASSFSCFQLSHWNWINGANRKALMRRVFANPSFQEQGHKPDDWCKGQTQKASSSDSSSDVLSPG